MEITGHMLVKNEENWIWFAIQSILPHVKELIICDTGSTDRTVEIIELAQKNKLGSKIKFYSRPIENRTEIVDRRQEMLEQTTTEWFLLVDGDEVWSQNSITKLLKQLEQANKEVLGAVVRTRNCVGDLYHYQPESAGEYHLKGRKGHLTIRAYRKDPTYSWKGEYPLEGYLSRDNELLNTQDDKLVFVDTYYYHLTHLKRSTPTDSSKVIDRPQKYKLEMGMLAKKSEIPEVFSLDRPEIVPNPFVSYSLLEKLIAFVVTPLKNLKRAL